MFYTVWWKDLEGVWIEDEVVARDFEDADEQAARIAEIFGTGEHRTEIFGRSKSNQHWR